MFNCSVLSVHSKRAQKLERRSIHMVNGRHITTIFSPLKMAAGDNNELKTVSVAAKVIVMVDNEIVQGLLRYRTAMFSTSTRKGRPHSRHKSRENELVLSGNNDKIKLQQTKILLLPSYYWK